MRRITSLIAIGTILFSLFLSACSKEKKDEYPHLQYIPADTPYAFLGLEPAPEKVLKKFENAYSELGEAYISLIKNAMQKTGDYDQGKIDKVLEENPWLDAVVNEFTADNEISLNAIKKFGIDSTSTYALYGNGVLPVMRIRLSDPKLFNSAITRIEAHANDKIPSIEVQGNSVWEVVIKKINVHFAVHDNDLVVSASPLDMEKKYLPDLLGYKKPGSSLATNQTVHTLMQDKGYLPVSVGFIEFEQILDVFITPMTGINEGLATALGKDNLKHASMSDTCKSELRDMINTAPRLVYGATAYDEQRMDIETLLEIDPALAKQMTGFTSSVPGLGQLNGLFSMGFSFNLKAIREFAQERIAHLEDNPYQCEFLQIPEETLAKAKASLINPASGMVESVRGFNIVLDEIDEGMVDEFIALESTGGSESEKDQLIIGGLGGHAVISVDDTQNLYNMGKMFSPELAQLDLKPDGKPKPINAISPQPLPIEVQAAMTDTAYIFSFGKNAETKAALVQGMKSESNSPLISYAVDMNAYVGLINKVFNSPAMQEAMLKEGEMSELSEIEDMQKIMNSIYKLFDTMIVNFRFRDDGLVMEQKITLK